MTFCVRVCDFVVYGGHSERPDYLHSYARERESEREGGGCLRPRMTGVRDDRSDACVCIASVCYASLS